MAKQEIKLGFTDYTALVFIPDPASTDGSGKTGLVAANLTVSGTRVETDNDVICTDYTSSLSNLSALTDAHGDWGLKEVSSTLAPGLYRLDIADAIFAAGAWTATVYVMITTSAAAASPMEFILVANDKLDGVRGGLTALPNAAADAAGGLPISDAGGLDLDAKLANTNEVTVARMGALTDWINGGRLDLIIDAVLSDTNAILVDTAVIGVAGAGLTDLGGMSTTMKAQVEAEVDDSIGAGVGSALTTIPWNAAWDAEVQSEVADALAVYDPPTNAEMEARTLVSAGYASPTNITGGVITTVTNLTNAPTSGDLTATMKASVNTEVLDVLNVDTFAEPGQGTPAATNTLVGKIGQLFKAWRNRSSQTATAYKLYNDDATTVDVKATLSDDATTFESGEKITGP